MPTVEELVSKIDDLATKRVSTETFQGAIGELKGAIEARNKEVKDETEKLYGTIEEAKTKLAEEFAQKLADAAKVWGAVQGGSQKPKFALPDTKIYGENMGDFLHKIRHNPMQLKTLAENVGSTGGYLVPPAWANTILTYALEYATIRSYGVNSFSMPSPEFNIPALYSATNNTNYYGGVLTYWGHEASTLSDGKSAPKFSKVNLAVNKLFGYFEAQEDLTRDAFVSLAPLLEKVFGQSLGIEENSAFFSGDGVGKPLGVVKSPCRATVSRGTASQIHATDIIGMLARFNGNMDNAVLIANQSTITQIYALRDPAGSYIWNAGYTGNIAGAVPGTVFGIPIVFTQIAEALGTEGDLVLGDWRQYIVGDLDGLRIEESTDYKFGDDIRCWKIIKRLDGKPWLPTAITPKKGGSTLSPFVTLV
jgi:HK97 family phage major capsid protein